MTQSEDQALAREFAERLRGCSAGDLLRFAAENWEQGFPQVALFAAEMALIALRLECQPRDIRRES